MENMRNVLVVDDDPEILTLLEGLLARNGMQAITAKSAAEAEAALARTSVDLMVLDLMMPGEDGLSFCRRLRAQSAVPILMLSALSEDVDRIIGLELGADDYLPKPFNPRELIARIRSIARRAPGRAQAETKTGEEVISFGDYRLYPDQRALISVSGETTHLTSGEYLLLLTLIERAPRVLTRDQLLDLCRGAAADPFDRSIDSQISRLRKKIEKDPRRPEFIKTVRSMGYAFAGKVERSGG